MTAMPTAAPRANHLDDPSVDLSSNRTAMSFERTLMSTDRTLMSVVRTSLSLIGFGFTIYQFLGKLSQTAANLVPHQSARNFGSSLVFLGLAVLISGLVTHAITMRGLRARRRKLFEEGLLHSELRYNSTPTAIGALMLLAIGVIAVVGMVLRTGPFR